jgi:hypothetical protein
MNENIVIGTTRCIRACGHDEYWLQDQTESNPGALSSAKSWKFYLVKGGIHPVDA